jgi:hypothetical protein
VAGAAFGQEDVNRQRHVGIVIRVSVLQKLIVACGLVLNLLSNGGARYSVQYGTAKAVPVSL